jgi:hypothetical protein
MSQFSEEKSRAFYWAAYNGDLPQIKTLSVDPEVNLNMTHVMVDDTRNAFGVACLIGQSHVVRYLLDFNQRPIDYNTKASNGRSPFFSATIHNHPKVVEMLLADERIDVIATDETGYTPLWIASCMGHLEVVEMMLSSRRNMDISRRNGNLNSTAAEVAMRGARVTTFYSGETEEDIQQTKTRFHSIASLIEEELNGKFFILLLSSSFYSSRFFFLYLLKEQWAGQLFADVVFLCDGFWKLPEDQEEMK